MALKNTWVTGESYDATAINAVATQINTNASDIAALPTATSTTTFTNKRVTPRITAFSNTTSWTINADNCDRAENTGLTGNVTINNPTGTPTQGQTLWIAVTGTAARTIAFGTAFEASTVTLPTTTVTTARLDMQFVWNSATSKWRLMLKA